MLVAVRCPRGARALRVATRRGCSAHKCDSKEWNGMVMTSYEKSRVLSQLRSLPPPLLPPAKAALLLHEGREHFLLVEAAAEGKASATKAMTVAERMTTR